MLRDADTDATRCFLDALRLFRPAGLSPCIQATSLVAVSGGGLDHRPLFLLAMIFQRQIVSALTQGP
ncbi:hypothetical protein DPM13_15155 [Paracoccus mutanolyticus]|uniref:Uncharacterized protein n=1 Tax=Paracoccus mutanolyticus TaxID=1499308 RepID=A0ABN5MA33_9RHOB|nr:hypothetical protein DPM13_15155 [Paracoccus mutanolyticus]